MKILIADDNRISLIAVKNILSKYPHQLFFAEDGEIALQRWKKERPEVLITDLMMPNMSGLELIQHVRAQHTFQYTYIIVMTGKNERSGFLNSYEYGADDFLAKPIQQFELVHRLMAAQRIVQLQQSQLVLYTIGQVLEARDMETGNHIERVQLYTRRLATQLQKNPKYTEQLSLCYIDSLALSSTLHDIGKVGIPDVVLRKVGKFTPAEYETMKKHTLIGAEIIDNVQKRFPNAEFLEISKEVILSHHEHYDGSGYPHGISSDEIPLSARIVALADVYDALRSPRVYKEPYDHDRSMRIIQEASGKHFDPDVVQAFLQIHHEMESISNEFR